MDVFYTSSGETEGTPPAEAGAGGIAVAGPAADSTEPCPTDAGAWLQWLERAGFSPAEAARLVFERLRPRDEGTSRI